MRAHDKYQLVALVQIDGDLAALSLVLEVRKRRPLDNAVLGHHGEECRLVKARHADDCRHLFVGGQLQDVDKVLPLRGSGRLGDHERLARMHLARVGEHHEVVVTAHGDHALDEVFVLGCHADDALAATMLRCVGVGRQALDVAGMGHGNDAVVALDQILKKDVVCRLHDLGAAGIGVLVADGGHFVPDDASHAAVVREDGAQVLR